VREYQQQDLKVAQNNCEEFLHLMGTDSIAQIEEDIQRIEKFKATAEEIKADVWEARLESNRIQTALVDADPNVDVKLATDILKKKYATRKKKTEQLKQEYDVFVKEQKRKYDIMLKEKREEAERERLRKIREEEERKQREAEERELARLRELERQRQEEEERRRREEEERQRLQAEAEEKARQEEKRQQLLEQLRIKGEIQEIINREAKSLAQMARESEELEMKQREVEMLHEKRRELCTDPNGLSDEKLIDKMLCDFTTFSESMQNNEEELIRIGRLLTSSKEDAQALFERTDVLVTAIEKDWKTLTRLKKETEKQHDSQQKLLTRQLLEIQRREDEALEAAKRRQEEIDAANAEAERLRLLAEEQRRRLEEEARLRRLREEEEAARFLENERRKRMMEEEERRRRQLEEEEERRRRALEEEEMRRRQRELEELEARLVVEQEKVVEIEEQWRNFDWDEIGWDGEYAGELLGFLSNPGLLASMIRDPRKIAEILRRAKMMAEIKERLRQEAAKMEYICRAIEAMVQASREAEERRWARQNQEWIHDKLVYNPADSICSTHEASFTPASTMSLEESRRLAAERKVSRGSQLAPVTLQV
jgi:trichohyalin